MKLYFLSNHQSNLKSKSSSLRLFLSFRLIFNTISREREQFSNIFLFLINNSLLSFSFLFFPLPPSFQFDHFLNAANSKKYQEAIDLWKLAFRKSALSSLDLARFISDSPRKKFLCVCVSIITTICVNADHPRARTERWLMPPISGPFEIVARSL